MYGLQTAFGKASPVLHAVRRLIIESVVHAAMGGGHRRIVHAEAPPFIAARDPHAVMFMHGDGRRRCGVGSVVKNFEGDLYCRRHPQLDFYGMAVVVIPIVPAALVARKTTPSKNF